MEKIIKIGLAILFFICLLDMPYGYFQLVRFLALIGFGFLAYQANQQAQQTKMIIYGALALLFQPFFKVALGRELHSCNSRKSFTFFLFFGLDFGRFFFWKDRKTSRIYLMKQDKTHQV